jgi:hypothetical protein
MVAVWEPRLVAVRTCEFGVRGSGLMGGRRGEMREVLICRRTVGCGGLLGE